MYAAKHSDKRVPFTQVHPTAFQVEMCGYKATAVDVEELDQAVEGCYFGWKSAEGDVGLIQPSMMQMKLCSPDGFKSAIARGEGNFVPLAVIEAPVE
jgi:hypothetical protein